MLTRARPRLHLAITRTEVLVLALVLFFVAAALLPVISRRSYGRHGPGHARIKCTYNLKQIGLAFRVFANDNDDKFPHSVQFFDPFGKRVANPAYTNNTDAWVYFQVLSNEVGSAKVLTCRMDRERLANMAVDFSTSATPPNFGFGFQKNRALSYFVGLDADETQPQVLLAGDRDLETNRVTLSGAVLRLTTNRLTGWTGRIHTNGGNIAQSDGSVQQMDDAGLRKQVGLAPPAMNRVLLPLVP